MSDSYKDLIKSTKDFYNTNATEYYKKTIRAENMSNIELFLSNIESKGLILDLGCGSGRDSLIFKEKGFMVYPIDYSDGLASISEKENGLKVYLRDFTKMKNFGDGIWNGIWANASLLHIPKEELIKILPKLYEGLVPGGYLYFSLKPSYRFGYEESMVQERFFAKYSEEGIRRILSELNISIDKIWVTKSTIENGQDWLNILVKKSF